MIVSPDSMLVKPRCNVFSYPGVCEVLFVPVTDTRVLKSVSVHLGCLKQHVSQSARMLFARMPCVHDRSGARPSAAEEGLHAVEMSPT